MIRLAKRFRDGWTIELGATCPACQNIIPINIVGTDYFQLIRASDMDIACPCGMMFYPAIPDATVKHYCERYTEEILECMREDQQRGEPGGSNTSPKRKKPNKAMAAEVRYYLYGS